MLELESRVVPSWWDVTAPTLPQGIPGDTDAMHTGSLTFNPNYTPHDGSVTIWGDTAVDAVTQALRGTITVNYNNISYDQVFDLDNVGTIADGKAYGVVVNGKNVTIQFEDMVNFPGATADMDYNDRSFTGMSSHFSGMSQSSSFGPPTCADAQVDEDPPSPPTQVSISKVDWVLVNANNDNYKAKVINNVWVNKDDQWKPNTNNKIPMICDYEVITKQPDEDPQLVAVQFKVMHSWSGVLTVSLENTSDGGKGRLWLEQDKEDGQFSSKTFNIPACEGKASSYTTDRITVFLEGIKNSKAIDDLTIHASFTETTPLGPIITFAPDEKLTIGPVVDQFEITGNTGVSAYFDSMDAATGIATGSQQFNGAPYGSQAKGLTIRSDLYVGDILNGFAGFVQVAMGVENGTPAFQLTNGDKYKFEIPGPPLLAAGTTFPFNDSPSSNAAPYPLYPSTPATIGTPNPNGKIAIFMEDTPAFQPFDHQAGVPYANKNNPLKSADITFNVKDYLIWQYQDGSIFTIATLEWNVIMKADTPLNGVFTVDQTVSKIAAKGTYAHTNEDPNKLNGFTFNEALRYSYNKV